MADENVVEGENPIAEDEIQIVEKTPEEIKADEEKLFTEGDAGHDYSLDFLQIKEDDPLYKVPEDETADFVGIGSLGHIIRKCFKDIYRPGQEDDDMLPKKTEDGEEGEETEETNNEKKVSEETTSENVVDDEEGKEEKDEKIDEDEDEVDGDGEDAGKEEKVADKEEEVANEESVQGSKPNTARTNDSIVKEEDGETPEEETEDGFTSNVEVPETPPILPLPYACEAIREARIKVKKIDEELAKRLKEADAIREYLEKQRVRSKELDEEDRKDLLESTGLLYKTELPRGESHFTLDKNYLSSLGPFGGHLIIASDLLKEIEAEVERERNPPSQIKKSATEQSVPHYMQTTSSMKVRNDINETARLGSVKQQTVKLQRDQERSKAREKKLAATGPPKDTTILPRESERVKNKKLIVDPSEKEVSDLLLERMNNKLNFMRNPRHDKNKYGGKAGGGANGLGNKVGDVSTAVQQPPYPTREMAFIVEPEKIQFTDYEVGKEYETTVTFRNVTPVSRRLRLLPPRSEHFAMALVEFPGDGGLVAPGMSVRLTVRFLPDSLADYQDALICITEQNRFKVVVEAFRPPPTLSIPTTLDCGCALLGAESKVTFRCTNHGGKGRFRCLPEEEWPNPMAGKFDDDRISLAPFIFSPAEFALDSGESVDLNIIFKPKDEREVTRKIVMVCDNCQVKVFTISGTGCRVGVQITSMGGLPVDLAPKDAISPDTIIFDPVTPGATAVQDLSILNLTPLELNYRWDIRGINASEFDMTPLHGILPLNGTVHFDVSFTPEEAIASQAEIFLVIENIPPEAVDDADPNGPLGFEILDEDSTTLTARDVACQKIQLRGAGKEADITILPAVNNFPGMLLPNKVYNTSIEVMNNGDAEAEIRWVGGRPSTSAKDVKKTQEPLAFELKFDPPFSVLEPQESCNINISFTPYSVGYYSLNLPCLVAHGPPTGIFARLTAQCTGPEVTIVDPEIDFGLVGVRGRSEMQVSFRNLSNTEANWSLVEVGTSPIDVENPRQYTNNNNNCRILFSPSSGKIGPNETLSLSVLCLAGKKPQRLRASLELKVENGKSSFCRARAEVQSPKVFLRESTESVDLGFTYVGVPVTRTLKLTNLSNLPADFHWNPVIGNGQEELFECFDVQFDTSKGSLSEKEEKEIVMTYTAIKPGNIDVLFACDVAGMPIPLGFNLKTISKGLLVSYTLAEEESDELKPGQPLGIQEEDKNPPTEGNEPANVRIVPTLNYGDKNQLMTRKRLRVIIRNFTAIPTSFEMNAEAYPGEEVPENLKMFVVEDEKKSPDKIPGAPHSTNKSLPSLPPGTSGTTGSSKRSSVSRKAKDGYFKGKKSGGKKKTILGDRHENSEQYRSKEGREHILKKSQSVENQAILIKGRGVAFVMTPASGILKPWGTVQVDVVCYNDMPGNYGDYICSKVVGLEPVRFKAKTTVVGSPLTLANTCVGLDQTVSPPEYAFGDVLRSTGEAYRLLKVVNSGPVDCKLRWTVKGVYAEPPLVDVGMEATGDKNEPIHFTIEEHPAPPPPPYAVNPEDDIVPSYGSKSFRVSFAPPDQCDSFRAMMVADGSWSFPEDDSRASTLGRTNMSGADLANAGPDLPKCLTVNLGASTIMPRLALAKELRKDVANFNYREKFQFVKFSTWSTHAMNHPNHIRTISLNNPTATALTFNFATNPPTLFQIMDVKSSAPKHPLAKKAAAETGPGARKLKGGSGPYRLLIGGTMDVTLRFIPPKEPLSDELEDKYEGDLTVTFANAVADEQLFKLHAYILKPMILVAPAEHRFGAVHVERWKPITLYLSNPTAVDAEWRIQHIPFHRPPKRVGGDAPSNEMMPMDEPSVFKFSMVAGTLMGPSLPLGTAQVNPPQGFADERKKPLGLSVTFKPETAVHYRSRFRFLVKNGQSFDVLLFGKGSFYEGTDRVMK